MEIPEFTCLCPKTGQPDFATLVLDYVPRQAVRRVEESQALHLVVSQRRRFPRSRDESHPRTISSRRRGRASCGSPRASTCAAGSSRPSSQSTRSGAGKRALPELDDGASCPAACAERESLYNFASLRVATHMTHVNPRLDRLQSYPFQKLSALLEGAAAEPALRPINLYIGEPEAPDAGIHQARARRQPRGLARYPATRGSDALRAGDRGVAAAALRPRSRSIPQRRCFRSTAAAKRCSRSPRRSIDTTRAMHADRRLPESVLSDLRRRGDPRAGAPGVSEQRRAAQLRVRLGLSSRTTLWERVQLVYVCSPANPTGHVMPLDEWKALFELSDRHGFVIASDECYSEIYFDEAKPPLGALQAAQQLGRAGYPRLVVFSSLSKRSNVPGHALGLRRRRRRRSSRNSCSTAPIRAAR